MPPKKKAQTISLVELSQQIQQQQQQRILEQQQKIQEEKEREAQRRKEEKKKEGDKKSKDKKKNKKDSKQHAPANNHSDAPSSPVIANQKSVAPTKRAYEISEECQQIMDVMKQILTDTLFNQIDFPIIFFMANVIAAQNSVQTKINEHEVEHLLATYISQTTYQSFDASKLLAVDMLKTMKEAGVLKELSNSDSSSVKILDEAIAIGKHFEDQLNKHKLKSAAPNAQENEVSVNYNVALDWGDQAQKKILEKKKKKDDKEKQAKQKEYEEFLRARGITSTKGIVKVHNTDTANFGTRDIAILNATITVGSKTLLQNANLNIISGKRYGLIGKNGIGKTTFLRHIAEREFQGIPLYLQIIHVEQEIAGDELTAIETVIKTDVERERLMQEEQKILAMADNKDDRSTERLAEIYSRMEEIDAYTAESRAAAILSGLSFTPEMQHTKTKHFSGGWRMRIALARALFVEPDVLLLDEPTNHLDLHAVLWLENYLQTWERTLIIVSHSRSFLNSVATDVIHFHNQELKIYKGNYNTFEKTRLDMLKMQQAAHEAQEKQRAHHQQFIDRFRCKTATARMVQSRIKLLEKMEFIPAVVEDPTFSFVIPSPEPVAPPYIQAVDVTFGYSPEKVLFKDLSFHLDNDSRIALVGPNGSGKSTFMKVLSQELKPLDGYVSLNKKIRIARFSQHHMDHLNVQMNPLEYMSSKFPGETEQTLRSHLGSMGLSGSLALQSIYTLSGGQRSRVVFSELTFKRPHLLLLDEPTNFLDLDTIDALIQALNEYGGGVLIISHDEHLITRVCDEIWMCGAGRITKFDGDFPAYKKTLNIQF